MSLLNIWQQCLVASFILILQTISNRIKAYFKGKFKWALVIFRLITNWRIKSENDKGMFWKRCKCTNIKHICSYLGLVVTPSPSQKLADLYLPLFCIEPLHNCFNLLTKGNTMKKAFGLTPIFDFGVESFLLVGRSTMANQQHALISHLVRGKNLVVRGTFLTI